MELDTKERVLLALYTEYQKDLPNMRSIEAEGLELENDVFSMAIVKLENEGYINGVIFVDFSGSLIPHVRLDSALLTREGIDYVETKLQIEPTLSGPEKAKSLLHKLKDAGLDRLTDIIAKTAAELIKGQ